jgi:phospho-N-acetylmuramoyl-pentapeptide-transferase
MIPKSFVAPLLQQVWIALMVSGVLAYPIWRLLLLTKSRQNVSEYAPEGHQIKQGTPTMGGIIIGAGYLAAILALPGGIADGTHYWPIRNMPALILFFGFMLIGFADDFVVPRMIKGKRGLGWKQKIVMQLAFAILGIGMTFGWKLDFAFVAGVFIVLFYSNAFNFADGLDALAGTLLLGLTAGLVGIGLLTEGGAPIALIVAPLFGAVVPFLYLNAPPAKVFMGDVGSLPVGAVLGLAVSCLTLGDPIATFGELPRVGHTPVNLAVGILSLVLVATLVPVPLQILSVKLRKKKLFPYTPIHHAFEKAGWPETRVVGLYALTQLVLSVLAVSIVAGLAVTLKP